MKTMKIIFKKKGVKISFNDLTRGSCRVRWRVRRGRIGRSRFRCPREDFVESTPVCHRHHPRRKSQNLSISNCWTSPDGRRDWDVAFSSAQAIRPIDRLCTGASRNTCCQMDKCPLLAWNICTPFFFKLEKF